MAAGIREGCRTFNMRILPIIEGPFVAKVYAGAFLRRKGSLDECSLRRSRTVAGVGLRRAEQNFGK
jgi:hypothetical protein